MSVALRDVRPLALHDRRPTRRPARSRQQIARCACGELRDAGARAVTGMKLYNAGSFFDPRAVPPSRLRRDRRGARPASRA